MKTKRLIFIILASAAIALIGQWMSQENQRSKLKELTSIACDMVTARAQAGSTRDVHDQLYSFWRKHSPGSRVDVLVRRGEKEVGSRSTLVKNNAFTQTCQIENRPDYEISFQFDEDPTLSLSLVEKFAKAFIILLTISFLAKITIRALRELWSGQVLREVRTSFGLEVETLSKSNLLSRFLAKLFINSAPSLKPAIEKLQGSLTQKISELRESKELVLKLEEERLRADRFSHLVTMVRHDLKGPLSSLKITASGLTELPEESESLHQTIVSIEKIISDLDQKKVTSGINTSTDLTLEIAEVAIQEVVDEKSRSLSAYHGVKIDFEYNLNRLSPILCEPNHLRRMIANLVQNAIEASPKQSLIRVGVRHEQGQALIEVADQGSGIAPEVFPNLFKRGATFGKVNGSGEGLSFVKSKAESFGGKMEVVETSSEGAVFQLRIPLALTKAKFQAIPSDEAREKMAILDDEIEFQKFAWSTHAGYKEYFTSPQAFLGWVESKPKDDEYTYLVDLHLRNVVSGLDVIRLLGRGKNVYLATSDYLNSEALELSEGLGIGIVPKSLLFSVCRKNHEI